MGQTVGRRRMRSWVRRGEDLTQQEGLHQEGLHQEGPQPEGPQPEGLHQEGPHQEGPQPKGPQPEGLQQEGPQPEGLQQEGPQPEGPQQEGLHQIFNQDQPAATALPGAVEIEENPDMTDDEGEEPVQQPVQEK